MLILAGTKRLRQREDQSVNLIEAIGELHKKTLDVMAENHKRSMELEAELEEKRREQERHHEERMQSMMMYFMQQVAGHSTYSPTGFMPMPYSGFPSHSGPPFPNHSNSDHEVHDVVDDDTL